MRKKGIALLAALLLALLAGCGANGAAQPEQMRNGKTELIDRQFR